MKIQVPLQINVHKSLNGLCYFGEKSILVYTLEGEKIETISHQD